MNIGILTSNIELFPLFRLLSKYNNNYIIYVDINYSFYQDKDIDFVYKRVSSIIDFFNGCDLIIFPPFLEYLFRDKVTNFFKSYAIDSLKYSLIGKIGFIGDYVDGILYNDIFNYLISDYKLTDKQLKTKKFSFKLYFKQVHRKWFLFFYGNRDRMVRKTIKYDLRYFKDCNVDTLIPLNYAFFGFDKILRKYLNYKKIRYHSIYNINLPEGNDYKVKIYSNGPLTIHKKYLYTLTRGLKFNIEFIN